MILAAVRKQEEKKKQEGGTDRDGRMGGWEEGRVERRKQRRLKREKIGRRETRELCVFSE